MCYFENKQLLWKENLNSDGQQFHQYHIKMNNHLSPRIKEHNKKDHDIWHWKSRPWLVTSTKCGGGKLVNGIPPLLVNWISDGNTAFNIFQVYKYNVVHYYFLKIWTFCMNILCNTILHEYLMQHYLKLGGTNFHFKWVKVPGTAPYRKAWQFFFKFYLVYR